MKKVSLVSLGCSKNLIDAEQMLAILEDNGFEIIDNEENADIMIVNTCAFIDAAKQEAIDCILEHAEYKKKDSDRLLVVTGCLSQRYKDEIINEIPEVDIVIGTNEFDKVADIINNYSKENTNVYCSEEYMLCDSLRRVVTTPKYTAFVRIAEGCDNHCTYCIIPYIRGKYRSRAIEDIVDEAKLLAQNGAKEIVVIAQDTSRYGIDRYGEYMLPELLKRLCRIDGIEWIRLHYCYPEFITDELIDVMASEEKICNYLDIPIQHANDEILKKMGRKINKEQITELIKKLRKRISDIVIRTTIIVGFPTETDEQFSELRDFVTDIEFDRLGIFTYSQEEGTPAARMKGQVDEETKRNRQEILMIDQAEVSEGLNAQKVGKTFKVLVEGYDNIIKMFYGRTYADSAEVDGKVFFSSQKKCDDGEFVYVKITDYMEYDLYGEAVWEE